LAAQVAVARGATVHVLTVLRWLLNCNAMTRHTPSETVRHPGVLEMPPRKSLTESVGAFWLSFDERTRRPVDAEALSGCDDSEPEAVQSSLR